MFGQNRFGGDSRTLDLCGSPPRRRVYGTIHGFCMVYEQRILNHRDLVNLLWSARVVILVGTATWIIQLVAIVYIFQDAMRGSGIDVRSL